MWNLQVYHFHWIDRSVTVLPIPGKRSLRTIWDDFQGHLRTNCTGNADLKLEDALASHLFSEMVSMHEAFQKFPGLRTKKLSQLHDVGSFSWGIEEKLD